MKAFFFTDRASFWIELSSPSNWTESQLYLLRIEQQKQWHEKWTIRKYEYHPFWNMWCIDLFILAFLINGEKHLTKPLWAVACRILRGKESHRFEIRQNVEKNMEALWMFLDTPNGISCVFLQLPSVLNLEKAFFLFFKVRLGTRSWRKCEFYTFWN